MWYRYVSLIDHISVPTASGRSSLHPTNRHASTPCALDPSRGPENGIRQQCDGRSIIVFSACKSLASPSDLMFADCFQPPMTHLPSNTQYGSAMNEPGSRGSYPASYSSTDAMMNMAPSHYQGETHGLESSYATPHVDAYHHARHPYPPPPPTPVYGPPSHPPTPLSANPARSADYFGQQVDTQSSSSVYYVDQAGYEQMRQQAPTNLQPYELSNQMPYGSAMPGHPESTTGWSQPPEDMQNHQTHEQSYSWPPQHQHQQSAGW
jgi:hypothetical protein